tara:strand:- start:4133 stop:4690 length:558 start_codon:yes stop_codon:yes gene_type:complete
MSFWTTPEDTPKRNFRFLITIGGFGANDVVWFAKSVKVPAFSVGETEHDFLDNKFYFPGKTTWEEVSMTLVDPATPDATELTMELLENSGYSIKSAPPSANDGTAATISKRSAVKTGIKSLKIEVLDDLGSAIETWTLNNPFIKSVSFSDLDYSNEDLRTIDLSIRYDWATCEVGLRGAADPFFK